MVRPNTKFDLSIFSRIIAVSFLVITIFSFWSSDVEGNYYNLKMINLTFFGYQFAFFLLISGILIYFRRLLKKQFLSLLICLLLLVYLNAFVKDAPAFSLMVGATFVALPAMYFSLIVLTKYKMQRSKTDLIIAGINVAIFVWIVITVLININTEFILFSGLNSANINNDPILYGNRIDFLKGSSIVSVLLLLVYFFANKRANNVYNNKIVKIIVFSIVGLLLVYQVTHLSLIMVYRIQTLDSPTFDFGLFTQMFYNMKNFNGMVTTLERGQLLSHFSVHVSPIYYLILPIFMVFPFPETLELVQILIVTTGLIPLYLIAKTFKLSHFAIGLVLIIYMFHPALVSSSFYDLHENCFLAPLLLFILYFIIKQKMIPFIVAMIMTLMIKEDASINLIFVGLFVIFGYTSRIEDKQLKKRNVVFGLILIASSTLYFVVITQLLNSSSEGAMFWRYDNLNAYRELNSLGILITLFQNPSYLLATMFTPDKIYSLVVFMFMLGLIPLLSRNLADYWLIVPLVVFNFATTYQYQNQFGFQYYYGTTVLMIFMLLLNFKDKILEEELRPKIKLFSSPYYLFSVIALLLFGIAFFSTKSYIFENNNLFKEINQEKREFLTTIPRDKKILATGYLTIYLSDREQLYDIQFFELEDTDIIFDYIIIDLRLPEDTINGYQQEALSNGYEYSDLSNGYFSIFIPVA